MMDCRVLICLFPILAGAAKIKPASQYFDVCRTSLPNYDECLKNSANKLAPKLAEGIPEINIQKIDPLHVIKMELKEGSGRIFFKMNWMNMNLYGFKGYHVSEVRSNLKDLNFIIVVKVPNVKITGDCQLDGNLLALPVKGNGFTTFNFTGVTITNNITLEKFEKSGKYYGKIRNYKIKIEANGLKVHFSNLFNGNKILGESTNNFFNENWKEIFEAYRKLPERTFAEVYRNIFSQIFSHFSLDELFPK